MHIMEYIVSEQTIIAYNMDEFHKHNLEGKKRHKRICTVFHLYEFQKGKTNRY